MSSARETLALGLVVLAFVGGGVFMWQAFDATPEVPRRASVLPESAPLPQFVLVDHNGEPFGRESLQGRWSLLFFGFTNCPDICPATLTQLASARSRVLADGGAFPEIILISVDPGRDTPEAMAEYLARFGEGITGVTGPLDEIRKLTTSLGIYFRKTGAPPGNQNVEHTAAVMLINKSAALRAVFGAPHDIDSFVTDIPLITGSP